MNWKGRGKVCLVCTRALARLYEWDCWVPPPRMNWFSVCDVSYGQVFTVGICITKAYEVVSVQRCTLFTVVNTRWTTSNQKLLVLEPQWIKCTERAKRLLIPPVYSLRGIRACELHIFVTEVGQVKQTVTAVSHVLISFNRVMFQ